MRNNLSNPQQGKPPFKDSFEVIDGYRLHVRANSSTGRQVVVLIPGIGVSEKYYRRLACRLVENYDVIAIDLPGYGEAEKPMEVLDLKQLAGVLYSYIVQHSIKEPILIGQSMGCQIVTHFSVLYPDIARKLVLLSPTVNNQERSALMQFIRLLQDATRETLIGNLVVFKQYAKFGLRRFLVTQRYMIRDKPELILPHVYAPTLIVRGAQDPIVTATWVQLLQTITPHCILKEIPKGTHNFHWKYPQEAAHLCHAFITEP